MNIRRILSYIAVALLAAMIYTAWNKEHSTQLNNSTQATVSQRNEETSFAPPTSHQLSATPKSSVPPEPNSTPGKTQTKLIQVKTDTLEVGINPVGGGIDLVKLPEYPVSTTQKNVPIQILSHQGQDYYVAQSGLTNTGAQGKSIAVKYSSKQFAYTLAPKDDTLIVTLTGQSENGLSVTKSYRFTRGSYAIKLHYTIQNKTGKTWQGNVFTQLRRRQPSSQGHMFYTRSYDGAAISSEETPYKKITYTDMDKKPLSAQHQGGWVAMQQHYFLSAWVPATQQQDNKFYTFVTPSVGKNLYTIGFFGPSLTLPSGSSGLTEATLYVGPEIAKNLNALAPGLERTIDYGWLWWFSVVIFWIMSLIHHVVGNWGWAIVITTIVIKFVLYPLSATSFRSMARMRELQPKIQRLREQHGDDRQALSRATMELYRKEKINPVGGCLPMLIQIPVFIALYFVIIEAVQLRQAPFILWIHDLSTKDPYYVLPILMGFSMLLQQKLSPSSADPTQAKVMMAIPVVFTFFFLNFPAGLTLYWLVNNCVQILQQWWVNKTMDAHLAKKARKKKKTKSTNIFKK